MENRPDHRRGLRAANRRHRRWIAAHRSVCQPRQGSASVVATVTLDHVSKRFGDVLAVDDFSLEVAEGELLVLLGPSGWGKTTPLRMIAGFTDTSAGTVRIRERDVTHEPPYRRNIGVMFQNYALFPHLTVFENVAFGLRRRRVSEA